MRQAIWLFVGLLALPASSPSPAAAKVLERKSLDTLTAVEMNHGDLLRFTLSTGEVRTIELVDTAARVVVTNLPTLKRGFHGGGTVYEMTFRLKVDGQPVIARRYVPVQQSLYEPLVIDGLRIWPDGVKPIEAFLNDNHGGGLPRTDARLAVQEMTRPLAPQPLRPWYPNRANFIDVAESYNANDVWMGPYQGADLHGGLDINMPIGTPLWTPMDVDDQYYFNSLAAGDNNNRWRGVRTWPNGERWVIQAHHIVRLRVNERTPVKQGVDYAEAAGVLTGSHAHSHFVFKIGPAEDEAFLDAWILFWEIFENNRQRAGAIHAGMRPFSPAATGAAVKFDGTPSRPGPTGNQLRYRWTFGDGGTALGQTAEHRYAAAGIYPVTLTVDDGTELRQATQHLTVSGPSETQRPVLALASDDSLSFRRPPAGELISYGVEPRGEPFTLEFTARPRTSPRPAPQQVRLENLGGGALNEPQVEIAYREGMNWLHAHVVGQEVRLAVDASRMVPKQGLYRAEVAVDCAGALNSPQVFSVRLVVPRPEDQPASDATVDQLAPTAHATPAHWLSPQFFRHAPTRWPAGHQGSYLFSPRPAAGEVVRFQPDLAAGTYRLTIPDSALVQPLPKSGGALRLAVRVRHADGVEQFTIDPRQTRELGVYSFAEGTDGWVEFDAGQSLGLIVADAVRFARQGK